MTEKVYKIVNYNSDDRHPDSGGVISFVMWSNPELRAGLNRVFGIKPYEFLSAIIITEDGLQAKIVNKDEIGRG